MNYRPKHQVKVDGKMSTEAADMVGKRLASSALIAAFGLAVALVCWGLAQLFG